MNYYLVRGTSDPKTIGIKDGTFQAGLIRNELTDTFAHDYFQKYTDGSDEPYWTIFDSFPDRRLDFGLIELRKKAKATDFISFYPNAKANGQFFLSKKACDLFRKFNLPKHEFVPVTIHHSGQEIDSYKYLFSQCLGYEFIDFKASSFFKGHSLDKKYITVNDSTEWEHLKEKELLSVENIVLKNVDRELDYFSVKVAVINFYISDRLKKAIEQEGLSGLNILPMREPFEPRIKVM
jgi:hypothetical protein